MTSTIDFDAFRAERAAEPLRLKIGGITYDLPPSMPASLALDIIRKNAVDPDKDVPPEELERMGAALFGGDLFLRVVETHGITMTELPDLLQMVLAAYDPTAGAAPNRGARRLRAKTTSPSSKTGRSSSPTS